MPVNTEKLAERQARMRRRWDRARPANLDAIERDRRLGLRLAAEIDKSARFYTDVATHSYVEHVVQVLGRNGDVAFPFIVKIIESDEINLFSLPGGFLYVTTGLLKSTETEAQLAGLLSHEIAHVLARHGTRQRTKRMILTWASVPLMFAGPAGFLLRQVAGVAVPLKFSRDAETEADLIGIDLTYSAGYDPSEYLRWMETAVPCAKKPSRVARMFDSYPVFEERLFLMQLRAADLPSRPEYVVSTSEFDDTRQALLAGDASQSWVGLRPVLKRRGAERNNKMRD